MTKKQSTPRRRVIKSTISQERRIKVLSIPYETKRRNLQNNRVPWINIRGRWLEQAGFPIDTPVIIRVMNGCLVFTPEP